MATSNRLAWSAALVALVGGSLALALGGAACGGSDAGTLFSGDAAVSGDGAGSGGDGGSGGNGDSGSTLGDGGGGGREGGGGGGDGGPNQAVCGQKSTARDCANCCANLYPQGAQVASQAEITCACEPTKCGTVCATTLCQAPPKTPSSECAACVHSTLLPDAGTKDCLAEANAACQQSSACVAYESCAQTECQGKP